MKHNSLLLIPLILLINCSEDDGMTNTKNTVFYDSRSYAVDNGLIDIFDGPDNHRNLDFYITDGFFLPLWVSIDNRYPLTLWTTTEASIEVFLELYSPGKDDFRTGTFTYIQLREEELDNPELAGEFFFHDCHVGIDTDGDNEVSEAEDIPVIGGEVTVSGVQPQYEVVFELQLANGSDVKGAYSGEFAIAD